MKGYALLRSCIFESRKRLISAAATDKLNVYIRIPNHEADKTDNGHPNHINETAYQGIFERDSEFHDRYFTETDISTNIKETWC